MCTSWISTSLHAMRFKYSNALQVDGILQSGKTPLFVAAEFGHFEVVKLLLEANPPASIDKAETQVGNIALLIRCRFCIAGCKEYMKGG